jgi:hypothetical protein
MRRCVDIAPARRPAFLVDAAARGVTV